MLMVSSFNCRRGTRLAYACVLALGLFVRDSVAQEPPRDGQHDFDFEIGTWKTHLRRLPRPLTGSTTWVEYEGTSVVSKVWKGRANLVELEGLRPKDATARVALFLEFAPEVDEREVPDPYYGGVEDFERVLDLCEMAARGLLTRLTSGAP